MAQKTKIRVDQASVSVTIEGKTYFGPWQTKTGGDLTSTTGKSRPGAMGDQTDEGGPATRNDMTLTHEWTLSALAQYKEIQNMVGWGDVEISTQWIDRKTKRPLADGDYTKTGTLKGCSDPDYDTDGSAVGKLTIVVGMDEKIA